LGNPQPIERKRIFKAGSTLSKNRELLQHSGEVLWGFQQKPHHQERGFLMMRAKTGGCHGRGTKLLIVNKMRTAVICGQKRPL